VDDLVDLIEDTPVVIFGHSYGGNVALAAAARLRDQVIGVSTFETPLSWLPWWPGTTAGAFGAASSEAEASESFMIRLIGQKRWDQLPERTKSERRREGTALVGELSALRLEAPWRPDDISCPVYAGFGSLGLPHHADAARWISEHVPMGKLIEIAGAQHAAPMTHSLECVTSLVSVHLDG
jgi:pimeloyl-ACP methyl ester carboxylesterase